MNLYEGIYVRKTIRHFCMESVDKEILDHIMNFTSHLEMLDENQKVQFEIIENRNDKRAPYFLVISALPVEGYQVNAGFLMQQVMLYIMTKELGSCFMKYHKLPVHKIQGFEPLLMIAFGKTNKRLYREAERAIRLPIADICSYKTDVSDDMKKIVNAARLAPSSFNSQPWHFVVYENRIHLFCKKTKYPFELRKEMKEIDVGIALANMYLAAEELWYSSEIRKIGNICERTFKNNEYLVSIIFQK
ncbi:MAG: nitroreductase family protein [Velocimicrobium sp.]